MLYNIKPISLQRVFHGIRFKVNEDWVSGIDTLLFYYPSFLCVLFIRIPLLNYTYNRILECLNPNVSTMLPTFRTIRSRKAKAVSR